MKEKEPTASFKQELLTRFIDDAHNSIFATLVADVLIINKHKQPLYQSLLGTGLISYKNQMQPLSLACPALQCDQSKPLEIQEIILFLSRNATSCYCGYLL